MAELPRIWRCTGSECRRFARQTGLSKAVPAPGVLAEISGADAVILAPVKSRAVHRHHLENPGHPAGNPDDGGSRRSSFAHHLRGGRAGHGGCLPGCDRRQDCCPVRWQRIMVRGPPEESWMRAGAERDPELFLDFPDGVEGAGWTADGPCWRRRD